MANLTEQTRQLEIQLKWDPTEIAETAESCNGCGLCRSREDGFRMCPIFRLLCDERSAPRSKGQFLQGVLKGTLPLEAVVKKEAKLIAESCIGCQVCRIECPAQVDVPYLSYRCKSAYAAAHGISLTDSFFSRIDLVLKFFSILGYPLNWLLSNRGFRWFLEKCVGISAERSLPRLASIPYLTRNAWSRRAARSTKRGERKVALFLDTYSNFFDTKLPEHAISLIESHGMTAYVPPGQRGSALPAIESGNSTYARRLASRNIDVFADLVRQGYHVLTLEPAAAVCFQHEYPFLTDNPDAKLLAENTTDLCTFLYQLHTEGVLRLNFRPVHARIAYHAPCRSIVLGGSEGSGVSVPTAAESLLRLVPGLDVRRIEQGCCGLAGTFGMKKANYPLSLRMGVKLFSELRDPTIEAAATDCGACKIQMEHGVDKAIFHPIKILTYAYGLSKDFATELEAKTGR